MIAKLNYYFKILTALTLTVAAGLAALLMASAPALGQDDYYPDPGTSPYDQETGVHRDTNVSMIFWGALDPTTVNTDTFKLVKQGTTTPVTATVTYYNWCEYSTEWMWYSCAAVLDPQADLEAGTTYTATVKGGENGVKWASNYGGTPTRSEDYSWSFTTSDDIQAPSPPTITSPQNNTSVSEGPFSVSGSAEASSIVELFEGTTSKGTTTADSSSTGAWSIDLSGVSIGTHTYYAKATDAAGNTSSSSDSVTVTVEDKTSPTVKSVYPNNGATGVVRNTDFAATFSEEMDPKTLITTPTDPADPTRGTSTTVTLVKEGTTTPISAKVMYTEYWNDHRVILSPPYPDGYYLDANTKYTVKIKGGTNGVKDLAGNQLGGGNQTSGDYWWSFTTGTVPGPNATTLITAPTNLTAKVGGTITLPQVTLKWTDKSNNEDKFVVERSEDNGSTWKVLTSSLVANTTSYTDKTVVSGGKTYTYRVKATKGAESSGYSNEASATTIK